MGAPLSEKVTVPVGLLILINAVSVTVRPETIGGSGLAVTVITAEFIATTCDRVAVAEAFPASPE